MIQTKRRKKHRGTNHYLFEQGPGYDLIIYISVKSIFDNNIAIENKVIAAAVTYPGIQISYNLDNERKQQKPCKKPEPRRPGLFVKYY